MQINFTKKSWTLLNNIKDSDCTPPRGFGERHAFWKLVLESCNLHRPGTRTWSHPIQSSLVLEDKPGCSFWREERKWKENVHCKRRGLRVLYDKVISPKSKKNSTESTSIKNVLPSILCNFFFEKFSRFSTVPKLKREEPTILLYSWWEDTVSFFNKDLPRRISKYSWEVRLEIFGKTAI